MRRILALAATVVLLAFGAVGASAQEGNFQRDTMIPGGDYDKFEITGPGGARTCAEACARDPRCQAWMMIRATNSCRLKATARAPIPNPCCVSGLKPAAFGSGGGGGKQEACAAYAREAVDAHDKSVQLDCDVVGDRWSANFKEHYAWCLRSPRGATDEETAFRADELKQCERLASRGRGGLCEHYERVTAVQVETNRKARCGFGAGADKERWSDNLQLHRRVCDRAPNKIASQEVSVREDQLAECFDRAGQTEAACTGYAEDAVKQFQVALDNRCNVTESRRWSTSKPRHYAWCLSASDGQRREETAARQTEVKSCIQAASLRKTCQEYADVAVSQSIKNERQKCGFRGVRWSKYGEDHLDFCLGANDAERRAEQVGRERDLRQCADRDVVDEDCDRFAKRAVRANEINDEQNCGLVDRVIWSSNYRRHYDFCSSATFEEREDQIRQRRRGIRQCSNSKGFEITLEF